MIIILSSHNLDDDRIGRHIQYLKKEGFSVCYLHFNLIQNDLDEGPFSLYGALGFRINVVHESNFRKKLYLIGHKILKQSSKSVNYFNLSTGEQAIIHVHNPELLRIASFLKRKILQTARVVYDRHEYYEHLKGIFGIRSLLLLEKIYSKIIDHVVIVSSGQGKLTRQIFPGIEITIVPNYPLASQYNKKAINKKISAFKRNSKISMLYIGSLNMALDRDISLLLKLADSILASYKNCRFIIGGKADEINIKQKLKALTQKYRRRFIYLGQVPRKRAIAYNEKAHFGFFLINTDAYNGESFSPNKVFEYLLCGVIPIVRANIDNADELYDCALQFSNEDDLEKILFKVGSLLTDGIKIKQIMKKTIKTAEKFSWEKAAKLYIDIYEKLGYISTL